MRATSATDNGFPSRLPTLTKPSGLGDAAAQTTSSVLDFGCLSGGGQVQNAAMLMFFGAGANNTTFSARLVAWTLILGDPAGTASNRPVWMPLDLFEVQVTLSSTPIGVATGIITATDLFADTITLTGTTANANVGIEIVSPANDRPAHLIVDFKGSMLIEPIFTTGGSATNCNGLLRTL